MQTRFNIKTWTLDVFANHFPGWNLVTWSDLNRRWHFEVTGPKGTWSGGGYYNERDASSAGRQSIYRAR
jgi:hypothetical protein